MGECEVFNIGLGKSARKSGRTNTRFHVAKNVSDESDSVLIAAPAGHDIRPMYISTCRLHVVRREDLQSNGLKRLQIWPSKCLPSPEPHLC